MEFSWEGIKRLVWGLILKTIGRCRTLLYWLLFAVIKYLTKQVKERFVSAHRSRARSTWQGSDDGGACWRQLVTWPLLWGGREMNVNTQLLSPFYSDQDLNSWKVKLRVKASLPTSVNPSQPRPGVCLLHDVRSCRVENIRHHHVEWNKGKK